LIISLPLIPYIFSNFAARSTKTPCQTTFGQFAGTILDG
jgi:hypothetical protein